MDCKNSDICDSKKGLVLIATVGKINQKDKEEGDRRVFQAGLDRATQSLWEMLKKRETYNGLKRDLIIVYDEGHNLSDQQTKILLDLNPNAILAASATMKVPKELEWTIVRLKKDKNYRDDDLIYTVSNKEVVGCGLIKKHIAIGGYMTPMEIAIDSLLEDMKVTEELTVKYSCGFRPKAIYVSDTNMLLATSEVDRPSIPFNERRARPIQIWKHLVARGIPPSEIAVYCDLKFDKRFPKPMEFNLFNGGDNDYDAFSKGLPVRLSSRLSFQGLCALRQIEERFLSVRLSSRLSLRWFLQVERSAFLDRPSARLAFAKHLHFLDLQPCFSYRHSITKMPNIPAKSRLFRYLFMNISCSFVD